MIDIVARALLFPLLYAQAQGVRAGVEPLPEPPGPRSGREGRGGDELRLLVVGDSSAVGVGAPHQDLALARPLAGHLAQRLGRPVRWTLLAQTGLTSAAALAYLKAGDAPDADVAVVVLGVNDITNQVPIAQALKHRGEIAVWLEAHAEVAEVLFPALPEMERFPSLPQPLAWWAGQMSRRNNRAQARWAAGWPLRAPRVAHVPMEGLLHADLMASDGFHPGPGLYARVAGHLAEYIARESLARRQPSKEMQ
jgi:lysophospholipase L1-like esterase